MRVEVNGALSKGILRILGPNYRKFTQWWATKSMPNFILGHLKEDIAFIRKEKTIKPRPLTSIVLKTRADNLKNLT